MTGRAPIGPAHHTAWEPAETPALAAAAILTLLCLRMQKIFSARLDEAALDEMDRVTRKLRMSKRQFLEEAIHLRARGLSAEHGDDVWSETLGAWSRDEKPETTIRRVRQAFRRTFDRRHPVSHARVRR